MNKFFEGLKVVELASVLAGPAVGMFFAELGAEVIKIENKRTNGDITRQWKTKDEPTNRDYSSYFCSVNWGKTYLQYDLRLQSDYEKVIKLIKEADIVISNFKRTSAIKMGLDYKTLAKLNSRLIYAQLNAFPNGENRPAFDIVLQAETGFVSMCGSGDGQLAKMPVALIDVIAAHQLKEAILLALIKRMRNGKGSLVKSSLYHSAISSLANQATNWLMNKSLPVPMGTLHPNIAPYGETLSTSDGARVLLAIGTDKQFVALCEVLNIADCARDERFKTNTNRLANRDQLLGILLEAARSFKLTELMLSFKSKAVPAGHLKNLKEVFEQPGVEEMILKTTGDNEGIQQRVRSIAFTIEE